jgi:DNA-binding response OmpR family regulator
LGLKIVFLEDNEDLLFLFKTLTERHFQANVSCFRSAPDFMASPSDVLSADLIVLDVNLGGGEKNGIDAYRWLQEKSFKGKIFFLTGHAESHPLVQKALEFGCQVLSKPLDVDKLKAILALGQYAKGGSH